MCSLKFFLGGGLLQSMLNENKRVRAKIQPTFEQLAMLHVAKVISFMHAFIPVKKWDEEIYSAQMYN